MLGKILVTVVIMAAIGMNASYTEIDITDTEVIVEEATEVAANALQFTDVDGNVLMEGVAEYISGAEAEYGVASSYPNYEYYVMVYFTEEGREKFKSVTESVVARTAEGENIINIVVDGEIVMSPIVVEPIYADRCIISGNLTGESARALADAINGSVMD